MLDKRTKVEMYCTYYYWYQGIRQRYQTHAKLWFRKNNPTTLRVHQQNTYLYDKEQTRRWDGQIIYFRYVYEMKQADVGPVQTEKTRPENKTKNQQIDLRVFVKTRMEYKT